MDVRHAVRWEGSSKNFFMYAIILLGYGLMLMATPNSRLMLFIYPWSLGILAMTWLQEKILFPQLDKIMEDEVTERFSKWHMENRTGK